MHIKQCFLKTKTHSVFLFQVNLLDIQQASFISNTVALNNEIWKGVSFIIEYKEGFTIKKTSVCARVPIDNSGGLANVNNLPLYCGKLFEIKERDLAQQFSGLSFSLSRKTV